MKQFKSVIEMLQSVINTMTELFPLANCASILCNAVDVLVDSCNRMAPVTVGVWNHSYYLICRLITTIYYYQK